MALVQDVFNTIAEQFVERATDIAAFVKTGYSFEEWLNWEAFAACQRHADWVVHPKPQYKKLGVANTRELADLLVEHDALQVAVEIGLAHGWTNMGKWAEKLNWDSKKLERLQDNIAPLQLMVFTTQTDLVKSDYWPKHLARVKRWGQPTELTSVSCLPPAGQLHIRGWTRHTG